MKTKKIKKSKTDEQKWFDKKFNIYSPQNKYEIRVKNQLNGLPFKN